MITFLKSQTASLLATAADFSLTFVCVELMGLWYGTASVMGTMFGAVVHFTISRKWVFLAGRKPMGRQAIRYGIVWAGYLALSFLLLVSLTPYLGLSYGVVKVMVAVALGIGYNYVLQKNFVFN